jgi:hypothetical protein
MLPFVCGFCLNIDVMGCGSLIFFLFTHVDRLQVVEIIDRYDEACVPVNMTENKLAYIQNETISKECIRNLTVISLEFHGY